MEWASEGADGAGDAAVEVGPCGDGDSGGEGGGVEVVLSVEDEGDVECFYDEGVDLGLLVVQFQEI